MSWRGGESRDEETHDAPFDTAYLPPFSTADGLLHDLLPTKGLDEINGGFITA